MAALYANENFPLPVVEELRRLGHDVETVAETGNAGQAWPDPQVLAHAIQVGRAVLTLNRKHFKRLHAADANHRGIVICTYDADFVRQAQRIHDAIAALASLDGMLIRVNRPSA